MIDRLFVGLYLTGVLLHGSVSNEKGHIGIVYDPTSHRIIRVHKHSPAANAKLEAGMRVLMVDGLPPGKADIAGDAGTYVNLWVQTPEQKEDDIHCYDIIIQRVPLGQIYD